MLLGTEDTMAAWCGASETRRKRAAEAAALGPLYEAGGKGETATACFWYGVGAMGHHVDMAAIGDALKPTARDVMDEALAGVDFARRDAFAVGLMANSGMSIKVVAPAWVAASPAEKSAVANAIGVDVNVDYPDTMDTAKVFHRLGGAAMVERDALRLFYDALTSRTPPMRAPMVNGNAGLSPWVVSLNLRSTSLTAEVIPPPRGGLLIGRDGRRFRVKSMAALAVAIGAQAVAPRIDFDHRSERSSPTFTGSTAAAGWLSNFRVNENGGIDADMALGDEAAIAIRDGRYRHLSPAFELNKEGEIIGLSSVALVNDPNLALHAPAA